MCPLKREIVPSMVAHTCNPITEEAEVGRLQALGQPEIHIKTLSQKKKKKRFFFPGFGLVWFDFLVEASWSPFF
jgi:hypothetical protein